MANSPPALSSARIAGTARGRKRATARIQAASAALRSTGASHNCATLSLGSARLTQKRKSPASTRLMSEETPPASGVMRSALGDAAKPRRIKASLKSAVGTKISSVGGAAAGEVEDGAGRERTFAAGEPADQRRGFVDRAEALHRNFRSHIGDVGRRNLFEDRRVDRRRRDRIDGHAVLGELLAERLREADRKSTRGAIGGGGRIAFLAGDRGDIDDAPVAARFHQLCNDAIAVEEPVDVDVEDPHLVLMVNHVHYLRLA